DTERLEGVDIGAVVDLTRIFQMPAAVAGQKRHADAVQLADDQGIRWRPEGSLDGHFADAIESFDFVEPAAADDPDISSGRRARGHQRITASAVGCSAAASTARKDST